ncbi:uncharacterized protein LOC130716795 isoform X2 [Lotus japonicus]|uniref:uncharacterized protein LOC130716795 isoform X2 n=1 Tax=Lotus japonicus TaxID=34305 RepID=UPI00258F5ADC|nr:uncharacterized protein LOC130716795 isoform X2 [Lotus japonicus]
MESLSGIKPFTLSQESPVGSSYRRLLLPLLLFHSVRTHLFFSVTAITLFCCIKQANRWEAFYLIPWEAFTLASFFERYKNLDLARNFQFPTLRQNSLETKIEKSRKKLKEINNRAKKICGVNKQNMSTLE